MLFHNAIKSAAVGAKLTEIWVLPGGHTFFYDGDTIRMATAALGWPEAGWSGDPWITADGKLLRHSSYGTGQMRSARYGRNMLDPTDVTQLGGYGAYSGETVSVSVSFVAPSGGAFLPAYTFAGAGGITADTGPCGDWSWNLQTANDGSFIDQIQTNYLGDMPYRGGAIATRYAAFVLRRPSDNPSGFVGFAFDGVTLRGIQNLDVNDVMAIAGGFLPGWTVANPIGVSNAGFEWNHLAPIGVADDGSIEYTGAITLTRTLQRMPSASEARAITSGRYGSQFQTRTRWAYPLDGDVNFIGQAPVRIEENGSVTIFVTGTINRFGFVGLPTVTGATSSAVVTISVFGQGAFNDTIFGTVFRRGGSYDVFWPGSAQPSYSLSEHVTPAGWRIPIYVASDPQYSSFFRWASFDDYGSQPPAKPVGAPRDWVPPPLDIAPGHEIAGIWRGIRYGQFDGSVSPRGPSNMASYLSDTYGDDGGSSYPNQAVVFIDPSSAWDPSALPQTGAHKRFGAGSMAVGKFIIGGSAVYTSHPVGSVTISAPVTSGTPTPTPVAPPSGAAPFTRLFSWPSHGVVVAKTWFGEWIYSLNGGSNWGTWFGLGEASGSLSVTHRVKLPPVPD